MATKYRASPREGGKYYAIERSSDDGKTWVSAGDSAPTQEEAQKKVDNLNKGLTAKGLTQEEATKQVEENPSSTGASIGKANPASKSVLTKEEAKNAGIDITKLPSLYELEHPVLTGSKATDEHGYIDNEGKVHLNGRTTEARERAVESDRANGRDYKTATAPSQYELDLRNGNFTDKDINGNYTWTNDKLLEARRNARESGDKELEQKLQAEINRRYNAGEAPEFNPTPKAEEPKEETKPEIMDEPAKQEAENALEDIMDTNAGNSAPNNVEKNDNGNTNTKKKGEGWKKFVNGDEEQYKKFLSKANPSLIKAVFGNSGVSLGDRLAGLGEILATITANTANGIYAGVNKTSFTPTQGRMSKIYNQAAQDSYGRSKDILDTENKAKKDKANRLSTINTSPILKGLPDDVKDLLADKLVTGISDSEWRQLSYELGKTYNYDELESIKSTFDSLRDTFGDVTAQRTNVVELNGKEFDLMRKPQEAIMSLRQTIADLKKQQEEVASLPYEKLTGFMQSFKATYAGIMNVSSTMSKSKEFGYNASTSVRGGIPVISGTVSGGVNGGNSASESEGMQADQLALEGILEGKVTTEQWKKETDKYRKAIIASLQIAIDEATAQIATLQDFQKIDDGIVKAPHMKQWLQREDGTRIALNPSDNIYATKNKITTKKDNGQDVVPMEKEDKAVTIQKKLGYGGNGINKQFDYYLTKLK